MLETTPFDMAEYLDTEEERQGYIDYVSQNGTEEELLEALNTVARARGMTKTAEAAGLTREGLYKALSPNGNPSFATVCKILKTFGYRISFTPIKQSELIAKEA